MPSLASLQLFTLQLGVMLGAGLPLQRSLEILSKMPGPMAVTAYRVLRGVESGKPLSQSMEDCSGVFPLTYRRAIRVGENSGQLLEVLPALSSSLANRLQMQARLRGALTYPAFVLMLSSLMVAFLLFYQVPRLLSVFGSAHAELPGLTRLVLVLIKPLAALAGLTLLAAVGVFVAARRSERWRTRVVHWAESVPRLGALLQEYALIQLSGELAMLLRQGLELSRALRVVREGGSGWPALDRRLGAVLDRVVHGTELWQALESEEFPRLLVMLVRSSEELGSLHSAFAHYFEMGQSRLEDTAETFLRLVEPALHMFMGFVVGTLVLACFLPVYQSISQI